MESMNEKERGITNPLRLIRCGVEIGGKAVQSLLQKADDALDVNFDPSDYVLPEKSSDDETALR